MTTTPAAQAARMAADLAAMRDKLDALQAEAEDARLPTSVSMELHWLSVDLGRALADLQDLATRSGAASC